MSLLFVVLLKFLQRSLLFFFTTIWNIDLICCTVNRLNGQNSKYYVFQKQKKSVNRRHVRNFVEWHNNISTLSFPESLRLATSREKKHVYHPEFRYTRYYTILMVKISYNLSYTTHFRLNVYCNIGKVYIDTISYV